MNEAKQPSGMTALRTATLLAAASMANWNAEVERLPRQPKRHANKTKKARRKIQQAGRRANRK